MLYVVFIIKSEEIRKVLEDPTLTLSALALSHHLPNSVGDHQHRLVLLIQLVESRHLVLVVIILAFALEFGGRRAKHVITVLPDHQLALLPLNEMGGEVPQVPILSRLLPLLPWLPQVLHLAWHSIELINFE